MKQYSLSEEINSALEGLKALNPDIAGSRGSDRDSETGSRAHRLQKVLVANRGEIAKRFFLALHEEGIPSVASVADPDRGQSWYEFADEVIFIGDPYHYASIPVVIAAALLSGANAVYSGYGFLSENAGFVRAIDSLRDSGEDIIFMGPDYETMRRVGSKIEARRLARDNGIPVLDSTGALSADDPPAVAREGARLGYPLYLKLSSGAGGRGIYRAEDEAALITAAGEAARLGRELYGDSSCYLERLIRDPVHFEAQIFNGRAIGIRKCAVQRRNQKIIEESGHCFLDDTVARDLLGAAEKMAVLSGYDHSGGAGTVEFLLDSETGRFGFMEMNSRLQVEYAVTDQSLGIDLAKWQILFFDGRESEIPWPGGEEPPASHSIECRIYAEEPENDYLPSPGKIIELDLPTFNGIRCDFGFMEGDTVLPMYDPMIGKLIAHGATRRETIIRLERALQELYIGGVKTNIGQLLRIVRHHAFIRGDYTNTILGMYPELASARTALSPGASEDRRAMKQTIFGAFTEHLRHLRHSVGEFIVIAGLGSVLDPNADPGAPSRYTVEHEGRRVTVDFLQTAIDTFHAFVNGLYNGKILLTSMNDRCDDFLIVFGSSSYRLRANRHPGFIELRMKDDFNKINYYRVAVATEGSPEETTARKVCSPFQGTFVSFSRDLGAGDTVREGEPLMVLSSMKMETVITAPAGGRIISLIEDGDTERLHLTRTAGGRVMGRSVNEGEVLAVIETADIPSETDEAPHHPESTVPPAPPASVLDHLFRDDFSDAVLEDPAGRIKTALEVLHAATLGFVQRSSILESLKKTVRRIPPGIDGNLISDEVIDLMNSIILFHTGIKKLFSPVITEEGLSFLEELDHHIAGGGKARSQASRPFERLLRRVVDAYGISRWEERSEMSELAHNYVFLLLGRAYRFSLDQTDLIKKIVEIISAIRRPEKNTLVTLAGLMEQEQAERDDSLLKFIKRILAAQFDDADLAAFRERELSPSVKNLYVSFRERFTEGIASLCAASLSAPAAGKDVDSLLPPGVRGDITRRLAVLGRSCSARRLYSPMENVWPYLLDSTTESPKRSFMLFTRAATTPAGAGIAGALAEALQVAALYRQVEPGDDCWIEVFAEDATLSWVDEAGDGFLPYREFRSICESSLPARKNGGILRFIINIGVRFPFSGETRRRSVLACRHNDFLSIEFLLAMDRTNPYHDPGEMTIPNQRLIDLGKWPIEAWAESCFDPGTMREIRIPSIDETNEATPGDLRIISRPPGAKIYQGLVGGLPACFYMKDSRVSGGSTGSREGLKYVAAAYLAYMNDCPLYVWNDSAGANIMEGVISLNRGAQGFMINALLTERARDERVRSYIEHAADPDLKKITGDIDREYGFGDGTPRERRSFQLTAIGIGSSAGLDVYGSSQASIQILLDSEESYRVLTGSKVVHTVIGEEITNYDIGGAKILGTWTGIVDVVAADKLHLIACIHLAQGIFTSRDELPGIARSGASPGPHVVADPIALNESMIRAHVDCGVFWPFKENYYAAESLIGGFALIGGRRALIMGPRTHGGLRSLATVIKARELLRTAHRTGSHRVLVFGARWQQTPAIHEQMQMRPRIDFMNSMMRSRGLQIHIITHPGGLRCFELNCAADSLIYVRSGKESAPDWTFAQKNAGFIVDSLGAAFDLAHRLIAMIDPAAGTNDFILPRGEPAIPRDAAEPYDIVESVILHAFDEGSFLEFHRDMNNPITGPHLITGLAGLEGRTVGVIADQPLLKGGGADAFGTEKFRVFTEFLSGHGIPLVMLSNSSGFVPGSQQERHRIQAIGAESLDANILGTIPVVSVVLNQNYGGRLIHAYNRFLRPGIVYLALEKAIMAVIGVSAAFDLLYGKRYARLLEKGDVESAEELKREFSESYIEKARAENDGVASGLVDWTIPVVAELRTHLIRGMKLAFERCRAAFGDEDTSGKGTT